MQGREAPRAYGMRDGGRRMLCGGDGKGEGDGDGGEGGERGRDAGREGK